MVLRQLVVPSVAVGLACLSAGACSGNGTDSNLAANTTNGSSSAGGGSTGVRTGSTVGTSSGGATNSGGTGTAGGNGTTVGTGSTGGASGSGGTTATSGTSTTGGTTTGSTSSTGVGGSGTGPATTCTTTVTAIDVSTPTTVIGSGTAASCTEATLAAAVATAGKITFNCGAAPAVIPVTKTIVFPITKDTTIDGGNNVTIDGGNKTQIFTFTGTNFQTTKTTVTLQHIRFANARATGSNPFPVLPQPSPCSQGFQAGGGGVIQIRDGVLHVIDAVFETNHGATPGPDIAGGAIYAIGSLDVTVVGSQFTDNDASNGGAIGSLFSDLTVIDSTFTGNKALGSGANSTNATCPVVGGQRETGDGGNGGAISIDGGETFTVVLCGDTFSKNAGGTGALGGALFRTPDNAMQTTQIDQSTFDGNTADAAGAMYFHNSHLIITNSTLSNNVALGSGAIQADGTILDLTNVTLYANSASKSPGGTISLFGNSGTFTNVTFAKNHCDGALGDGFGVDLFGGTALTINNSIFDSATQLDPNAPMACQNTNAGQGDLQWPKTHSAGTNPDNPCVTNIDFADPALGGLANNGGPTETALPAAGSPAIGAGKNCPATDQRGKPRPANGCTAGAVEN